MDFQPQYCHDLITFFRQSEPTSPPSLCKFALHMGVSVSLMSTWARTHSDFADALKEAKLILQDKLIDWGLNKSCDASFAKYLLSEPNALWPNEMTDSHIEVRITVKQ